MDTRLERGAAEDTLGVTMATLSGTGTDSRVAMSNPVVAVVAIIVALDLSASATFSAVNCGTAGIGVKGFPKVIIFGCALTCTGTGAVAIMAVER